MVSGRPDYTTASLIKGRDADGNLVTIAVDASGNIIGLMKGEYSGAPITLATDSDGRILARLMGRYGDTMIDVSVDEGGKLAITEISQSNVSLDSIEAQSWTTPIVSLLSNLNRIRYAIISMSGEAWGTFTHSIASTWAEIATAIGIHAANASAHHTKYTDGEAKAAAVLAGAITDGETKAPTHDAVFDVKTTADDHIANTTTPHGAVSAATASKIVVRDASARAKFAAAAAAGDALIKGTRVTVAELPALTDEKIWKGTGGDVEEVAIPAGFTFTELVGGQEKQAASSASWLDWDLSAIVPAGAKAVLVMIASGHTTTAYAAGARKNGSALLRYDKLDAAGSASCRWDTPLITECDADRVIEIYAVAQATAYFNILGYWS